MKYPGRSSVLSAVLMPFSCAYLLGVKIHRLLTVQKDAGAAVISVGNITTGGTGKTPLTAKISALLTSRSRTAVILRGYGRKSAGVLEVSGNDIARYGDEALMLKDMLGPVEVIVSENRYKGAVKAVSDGADVIVLDDGFQSWELKRELDIIAIDCTDPFGGDRMLPAGRLREPVSAVRRAQAAVLGRSDMVSRDRLAEIEAVLKKHNPELKIFRSAEKAACFEERPVRARIDPSGMKNRRLFCFLGIGNPEGFLALIERAGAVIDDRMLKADHHVWTKGEIIEIIERASQQGLDIVTTEKDAVRLSEHDFKYIVLKMDIDIDREDEFTELVNAAVT